MNQERWQSRGKFEELKDKRSALLLEIRSLTQDIHRRLPVPDIALGDLSGIDTKTVQVLLNRLKELESEHKIVKAEMDEFSKKWGFEKGK